MKRLLIFLPLIYQLQGCNSAQAESNSDSTQPIEAPVEPEIIHQAIYNEFANTTNKGVMVITTQQEYENELLKRSSEPVEQIDFSNESVLLIDIGAQTTGGYSLTVSFSDDSDNSNNIQAEVDYRFPGETCVVTTAMTNPYQFIKLQSTKYILVSEKLTYSEC
jgi:hypothetical protein